MDDEIGESTEECNVTGRKRRVRARDWDQAGRVK